METTASNKSILKPMTIAELLPDLSGILSQSAILSYSVKKKPRATMALPRTAEKTYKPLTIAEMRDELKALKVKSPRTFGQSATSTKKKRWNSSVKLENKTKSCTSDGQIKPNTVRKALNFQSKTAVTSRPTPKMVAAETPKFPKPEHRAKKSLHLQAKNNIRMSGVYDIPQTPVFQQNMPKSRRLTVKKENNLNIANAKRSVHETPKVIIKKVDLPVPVTPITNLSFKSNSDVSFLLKEKEIDIEERTNAICEERTLERIAEVSPPVSTPFKEYRCVEDFFNNTDVDHSLQYQDNTIMSFDNVPLNVPNKTKDHVSADDQNIREESVIISLCDMLNKATVTTSVKGEEDTCTELEDLLAVEKQTLLNIKMIEKGIVTLNNIKKSQLKSLHYVQKLIKQKKSPKFVDVKIEKESLLNEVKIENEPPKPEIYPEESPQQNRSTVIKGRSPAYKIPKRNASLRKKILYKSMPNVSDKTLTPTKDTNDIALNMYMQMKEKMNFLNTPVVKHRTLEPNTPSITSNNLQKQLDKLYNGS